ncbi:GBP domain containing protein, partial [Asbolus verrucosus]
MNGGQKLLDKILSTDNKNLPEEIISLRRDIKNLFKKINCFLLPHPGLEATNARFQGNLNVIDDKFKKYVEILAPAILAPENLVPKSVNGMNIKAKHLFRFIENYCEQFQYGNIPPTESLFK